MADGWVRVNPDPNPVDLRARDLITGAAERANRGDGDLFSETHWEEFMDIFPLTLDLIRFAVTINHPTLDLDWVADEALKYTGE